MMSKKVVGEIDMNKCKSFDKLHINDSSKYSNK